MGLTGNVILSGHSVCFLLLMHFYTAKRMDRKILSNRLHVLFFPVTILMLVVDIVSRLDGWACAVCPLLNRVANFLLFFGSPVLSVIWLLYAVSMTHKSRVALRRALFVGAALLAVNLALLIASQFTGWFYSIGPDNIYRRGPLYPLTTALMLIPVLLVYVVILRNRKRIEPKFFYPLLVFPVPPILGSIAQLLSYGTPYTLNAMVTSLLILSLFVQERDVYTDALTGAGNRRMLDAVIQEKMRHCSRGRSFSVVLLDVDNLKVVNDSYGHEAGDRLLIATAEMLRSCVRSRDYVIRYGGDEFVIVADISDEDGLNALISRIDARRRRVNEQSMPPLHISFSHGSAVYACGSGESADELLNRADRRMYAEKSRRREKAAAV